MRNFDEQLADGQFSEEFEDERERELVSLAAIGQDTQEWLLGPVGRHVLAKARDDQHELEREIVKIRPNTIFRRRKLVELQQDHQAIQRAVGWLAEQVRLGEEAERELQYEE